MELKKRLEQLSTSIQSLHRDLLMLEARKLEAQTGHKMTPYELLHASLNDPNLAWLRQMSALIVSIDETTDDAPNLSAQDANKIANEVLALIEPPAGATNDFWTKYTAYLADSPEITMKHSTVKRQISELRPQN